MAREKLLTAVYAAQLQNVVSYRRFYQNSEVSAGGNWNDDFPDVDIQDILSDIIDRQPFHCIEISAAGFLQMNDEFHIFFAPYRRFAKNRSNVQHSKPPNFEKIAQHGRAAPFERFRRNAIELHHIIRHQSMSAAHQFQRQFALADTALAGNHYAEAKNVEQYAMPAAGRSKDPSEIGT